MKAPAPTLMFLTALSACGGTTDSLQDFTLPTTAAPATPGVPDYNSALGAASAGLSATDRVGSMGFTAPADFQRSGTATFSGPIVLNDQGLTPRASVSGGITLSVDFADENNVTGLAGNFYDLADTPVAGALSLSNAEFSEGTSGGGFVGNLTGQLSNVGRTGANATYDYDVELGAIYYGAGVQGMLLIGSGSATSTSSGSELQLLTAGAVERE